MRSQGRPPWAAVASARISGGTSSGWWLVGRLVGVGRFGAWWWCGGEAIGEAGGVRERWPRFLRLTWVHSEPSTTSSVSIAPAVGSSSVVGAALGAASPASSAPPPAGATLEALEREASPAGVSMAPAGAAARACAGGPEPAVRAAGGASCASCTSCAPTSDG